MDPKMLAHKVRKLTDLHGELKTSEVETLRKVLAKLDDDEPITQKEVDKIDAMYRQYIDRDDEPEPETNDDDVDEDDFV